MSAQVATLEALTDAGLAAFACGDVLVVDGLGEGATCYFEDAYTLRVVPGAASAAAPGGAWLGGRAARRRFPGRPAAAAGGEATAVVVAAPPDAVEPAVALAAPAAVAACGAVAVDIRAGQESEIPNFKASSRPFSTRFG
ncbi:hypothetical protein JL722_14092 [Aureococcus anophagefferens]|nr:hypothetical protein JL722_14092 [Aureococcus anophagefferens]